MYALSNTPSIIHHDTKYGMYVRTYVRVYIHMYKPNEIFEVGVG